MNPGDDTGPKEGGAPKEDMRLPQDLKAYLDGELPAQQATEVEEALRADPALRRELEHLKSLSEAVKNAFPEVATVGFEQTMAALDRRPAARYRPGPLLAAGTALAAVFALAVLLPRGAFMEGVAERAAVEGAPAGTSKEYAAESASDSIPGAGFQALPEGVPEGDSVPPARRSTETSEQQSKVRTFQDPLPGAATGEPGRPGGEGALGSPGPRSFMLPDLAEVRREVDALVRRTGVEVEEIRPGTFLLRVDPESFERVVETMNAVATRALSTDGRSRRVLTYLIEKQTSE
jgi:hypothetical protein